MFVVFVLHDEKAVTEVLHLIEEGLSDYEIARRTPVSRSTVFRWRHEGPPRDRWQSALERPQDEKAYAYLLGMYLGDGWVGQVARSWNLKVALDACYPGIVRECLSAMAAVAPLRVTALLRQEGSVVILASCGRDWANLFPQHGPGKKHERKIELVDWQLHITHAWTREFIRGLIHSDGSRCINRFSVKLPSGRVGHYEYPRYFFTNYSEDIRRIFCEHCELLGIRWTQSNPRNISISHRDSVALLDEFVGPKS
jgi:Homeodomain-like domain